MRFRVKAPASSANLGPGFDALGLALDLWNELEIDTNGIPGTVTVEGADGTLLADKQNYSLNAMQELSAAYGKRLPGFSMTIRANVPVARGLGSSAAALACGLVAANALAGLGLRDVELFLQAWQMEGHGDNVGAAFFGGAVLAVTGMSHAILLSNGDELGLMAVTFIPEATSATWAARAALPSNVPLPDAAFNVGVASGLTWGLATGNREAIAAGMRDRLHEPYRARLFPHLTPMTDAARQAGAVGASLSGAGPTILTLVEPENVDAVCQALHEVAVEHDVKGEVKPLKPTSSGVSIEHF
ncbi:MAG: homoserine kinase [Thermomicrobiales bacterium]|nr:homoserine kinase [Thermomicrobiales bacterium]